MEDHNVIHPIQYLVHTYIRTVLYSFWQKQDYYTYTYCTRNKWIAVSCYCLRSVNLIVTTVWIGLGLELGVLWWCKHVLLFKKAASFALCFDVQMQLESHRIASSNVHVAPRTRTPRVAIEAVRVLLYRRRNNLFTHWTSTNDSAKI